MVSTRWFFSGDDLSDALYIRKKVFIEENNIQHNIDMDQIDVGSTHLVVYDNNIPVATGRMIVNNSNMLFSRITVLKEHRGKKYGDLVIRMLIRKAFDDGFSKQYVHAVFNAIGFYEKLGFVSCDSKCFEEDKKRVCMCHIGDVSGACK